MGQFSQACMKIGALSVLGVVVTWAVALTGPLGPEPVRAAGHNHAEEAVSVADAMGTINGAYRFISRNMKDVSKRAECLEKASAMLEAAVATRGVLPSSVENAPAAQQAAMRKAYRKQMLDLVIASARLEQAVLAGDEQGVKALGQELGKIKKTGHTDFIEE